MKVKCKADEGFFKCTNDRWRDLRWLSMTPNERNVYGVLVGPCYNGRNNGDVVASIDFISRLTGSGRSTISRALRGMENKAVIIRTLKGGVFRGKPVPSRYEICEFGTQWNGKNYDVEPRLKWSGDETIQPSKRSSRRRRSATAAPVAGACSATKLKPCPAPGLMTYPAGGLMGHVPLRDSSTDLSVFNDGPLSMERDEEDWRSEAIEPEELMASAE